MDTAKSNYPVIDKTKLSAFMDKVMMLNDLPGLAVGVSMGTEEFIGVSGYSNYIEKTPILASNYFHCASVSKLMTGSAVMKLVEAGSLSLDDTLSKLLPDLKIYYKGREMCHEIRLWNLLSHTSGMSDCDGYHWDKPLFHDDALKEYVYSNEVSLTPMLWEPQASASYEGEAGVDSKFRYSNIAYEILGHIVSEYSSSISNDLDACSNGKTSKLSYEDFIREFFIAPSGMNNSTMNTSERDGWASQVSNISKPWPALPHVKDENRDIQLVEFYPYTRDHAPSSTLTSTVSDLLKLGRAHLSGSLLKKETYEKVWTPVATVPNNGEKMGLGWFMRKQNSPDGTEYQLMGHEGTDDGFRASFWLCPDLDLTMTVLCNMSGSPTKKICKQLFTQLFVS